MKPIEVGDLVVVVKPTQHGCPGNIGSIFKVTGFKSGNEYSTQQWRCPECGLIGSAADVVYALPNGENVERLKRIPPLDDLETRSTEEVLIAQL